MGGVPQSSKVDNTVIRDPRMNVCEEATTLLLKGWFFGVSLVLKGGLQALRGPVTNWGLGGISIWPDRGAVRKINLGGS